MLDCKLCGLTMDPDQYAEKPYIFVIFRGGGSPDPLPPPESAHDVNTQDIATGTLNSKIFARILFPSMR